MVDHYYNYFDLFSLKAFATAINDIWSLIIPLKDAPHSVYERFGEIIIW